MIKTITSDDKVFILSPEYEDYALVFAYGLDGWETERGYRSHVYLTNVDKHEYYPLLFYEPGRLAQDLEYEKYIAEPGLVIIEDVTVENMVNTVKKLLNEKYFSNQHIFSWDEIKIYLNADLL
ncbi:MAG: hypothetical protein LBL62_05995 [Planctomycetaceae bacterium]|jgi:hypothetical protein|nr:hypothetical protein [Planctomycetaceae bacterium]